VSRRKADSLVSEGKVTINRVKAHAGSQVGPDDIVVVDGNRVDTTKKTQSTTILLHKPVNYVCSRDGQGSKTVYDLLPKKYESLQIAGRLDKDSSGLVVLTDDGILHNILTHPSYDKEKQYDVTTDSYVSDLQIEKLLKGVPIGDERLAQAVRIRRLADKRVEMTLKEGRNRQIRRMFESLGHQVVRLHRTQLGPYTLGNLAEGKFIHL
jgi:23S rRNA pseudouridine2605 synthase/23S rRNA pseudouridine2604 synthase